VNVEHIIRPEDVLWDKTQVAEYLRYKPRTLERVANTGDFPNTARPGNPKVWRAGDIIDWCRANSAQKRGRQSQRRSSGSR